MLIAHKMSIFDLIKKIGEKEQAITEMEFISPVFSQTRVATRIEGLFYFLDIAQSKPGWYKIRPINTRHAVIVEAADLMNIETYLKALDKVRLVLAFKKDGVYHAIPDKANKYDFIYIIYYCDFILLS